MLGIAIVAAIVPSVAGRAHACSECLCGMPFPSDALGGAMPTGFRFGIEERYLSKSNALDDAPGVEAEREHRVAGFVLWRAADRLALLGRVPYNVKEITSSPVGEASARTTSRGLGDAEAMALIGLWRGIGPRASTFAAVLGAIAPTGSNDARDATGARLDAHLQPGTGAWSANAGLNATLMIGDGALAAHLSGRWSGMNAHGYRYGRALLYDLGFTSAERRNVALLAQINGRSAGADRLEDGSIGANTGGTVVYASPGVRWRTGIGVSVEAALKIPVLESLRGDQREHTTGRLAFSITP
ncbi:MAG: transporter [Candidatus Eisenbacteria bacterium]|nr:transporter [Candidatus Eisenbacteria bacterium]